jgi:hypothetical protein
MIQEAPTAKVGERQIATAIPAMPCIGGDKFLIGWRKVFELYHKQRGSFTKNAAQRY